MPPLIPKLPEGDCYGALGRFENARELYHACEKVRDAGFTKWDAHTPFPVHGLEKAMGLKPSKLPFIALATGLSGAAIAMAGQWWVHAKAYPLIISGKPLFAWPAFVPVTFEVAILLTALGAVLGMLGINQLPMLFHPLFAAKGFERVTDDGFFVSIESWDPKFDPEATKSFLQEIGAKDVELVDS